MAVIALGLGMAGICAAQTSPETGPTVPKKTLPVPKPGDSLILNPTELECKAGWRPGLKWSKDEFEKFCAQLHISK